MTQKAELVALPCAWCGSREATELPCGIVEDGRIVLCPSCQWYHSQRCPDGAWQ